jgi:tetratricopeptide (TPR) repeat protein
MRKDALVKDRQYLERQIEQARKEYLASPTVAGKISAYVDALTAPEEESYENQAIEVLEKAHQDTGAYQFKMRIGDIRIRQMARQRRKALSEGDKEGAAELARRQLEFELQEFAERAGNYPTDRALKYELGRRELAVGRYDDAIASLQEAREDPRRRIMALNYLGQAFAKKGWHREAAETYEKALGSEIPEERIKELRYNLGSVLEQMNELSRAQDEFSTVAQIDYTYKDVRERLEGVRRKLAEQSGGS